VFVIYRSDPVPYEVSVILAKYKNIFIYSGYV